MQRILALWPQVGSGSRRSRLNASCLELLALSVVLSGTLNVSYPMPSQLGDWLPPAWEAWAIVLAYGFWVWLGSRVPRAWHVLLAGMLLLIRLFRFVDGFYQQIFHREFRLAIDLPLLPESVRLLIAMDGLASALAQLGLLLTLASAYLLLLLKCLGRCEQAFKTLLQQSETDAPRTLPAFGFVAGGALLGLGALQHTEDTQEGAAHRLLREAAFFVEYPEVRERTQAGFARVSQEYQRAPHNLALLAGRNVTLIVIESYGRGALDSRQYAGKVNAALGRFETRLNRRNRAVASGWLLPPSYGGGSWYAHATLATGIKVWSPLDYDLLLASSVTPLSRFMSKAGYRTINVMPGTTRVWTQAGFYAFDESLYAQDLEYHGPDVGWGRLPDQFVLDQVRRRYAQAKHWTYKEIKLVTSHVPWRDVPPVIGDWDSIRTGELYQGRPGQHFNLRWSQLQGAHYPYLSSIIYDLDVVGEYLERFESQDALVCILGDHQPVREAALLDTWDVPLHIVGPEELVARFMNKHFVSGLRPAHGSPALPMEHFLPMLLGALSDPLKVTK